MILAAAFDLNLIAQISATGIVDCLVAGTLIAAFAGLVLRIARQSSGVRFAVWFSALMAISVLPFLATVSWAHGNDLHLGAVVHPAKIIVPASWALYVFGTWAAIASIALARVAAGLLQLTRLRRSCRRINPNSLGAQLRETLQRHGAGRAVALCVSDHVAIPTAIGFMKPAVVIPAWLWHELSTDELNQVLLHELAHLRRLDDWTNLAQKIVKALLFFHPAVWWIEKKISLEREMACDDAVLVETASPRAYAECLAHLAEKSFIRRSVALAQAALGRVRQTTLRIARILDGNQRASTPCGWKPAVTLMAGFAVACAVGVSRAPRLVAFQSNRSAVAVPTTFAAVHPAQAQNTLVANAPVAAIPKAPPLHKPEEQGAHMKVESASLPSRDAIAGGGDYSISDLPDAPAGERNASGLIHLASSSADSAIATEAVFVVVETREYGPTGAASYQITVWRFTLRPAEGQISTIPRKQT